ncbi:MAG: hypothetical protein GXY03_05465 [Solirubrobacterales bacterium]|nr:hypothetical protein [Solirubrobacterales bacterium]
MRVTYDAGALIAAERGDDAAVVVAAGIDGRVVVTSDAGDLVRVAQAVGLRLVFKTV